MPDSLAKDLGEVPAKDVATFAKAATDQAAQWIKRIGVVTPGAGTLSFAKTLLKVSYSSDQRSRTGIFILIATGGKAFIDPISNKIIASDVDTLIKLYLQQETPEKRTTMSEYIELSGGRRGAPEAPCAAQQCGNGAPAPLVSVSTDFPNDYG